jgi:glycosyltransferase involved in cell wall biosynthesis
MMAAAPPVRVAHLTTVHRADDQRIAVKECASLGAAGYDVVLIHASEATPPPGLPIRVRRISRSSGRLGRMTLTVARMLRAALGARAELYHFHDPELIPVGFALKASGRRVIYDVHEDVPRQMEYKPYLPVAVRRPIGRAVGVVESVARGAFDGIVAATPRIATRFPGERTALVQNFPKLGEFGGILGPPYPDRDRHVVYVGRINPEIGAREMVGAIRHLVGAGIRLTLAGQVVPGLRPELDAAASQLPISLPGWLQREQVADLLGSARVGLVLFHPLANHVEAYPTKMFEYMSAGLPVVASDFPLWRDIVEGTGCGRVVDPLDPAAIASAVQWLVDHPAEAQAMGERGREAVRARFNWEASERTLLDFYARLLGTSAAR